MALIEVQCAEQLGERFLTMFTGFSHDVVDAVLAQMEDAGGSTDAITFSDAEDDSANGLARVS